MLGAKVAFHLCSFMELGGWSWADLSRLQGGSMCLHLPSLLRKITAGSRFSDVTNVRDKEKYIYHVRSSGQLTNSCWECVSVSLLLGCGGVM